MGVSGKLWSCLKEVKPLVVYDMECGIALEPMQVNRASSRVDLGYKELFCVPGVISVSFYACDTVLGDSLEFCQANQGSLCVSWGTWNCSAFRAGKSVLISLQGRSLMVFLELRWEPGVHSRIMAGIAMQNSCLFSNDRTPV